MAELADPENSPISTSPALRLRMNAAGPHFYMGITDTNVNTHADVLFSYGLIPLDLLLSHLTLKR